MQSKEVIDKVSDELKIQPAMAIPKALAEKIQLVYGINPPRNNRLLAETSRTSTTTNFTVATTHATRRTYLTGIWFQVNSNATATNTGYHIDVVIRGRIIRILQFFKTSATATVDQIWLPLSEPIELDLASAIRVTNAFGAGASSMSIIVHGYETDPQ